MGNFKIWYLLIWDCPDQDFYYFFFKRVILKNVLSNVISGAVKILIFLCCPFPCQIHKN